MPGVALSGSDIDWSRPWLASMRTVGRPLAERLRAGEAVCDVLNSALPAALAGWRFVPQRELPPGQAYEAFIERERRIPTRENPHDFFNGLVWLHWPQLKLRLNALQAEAIARQGVGGRRGPLRDAVTLLDENGALLLAPHALCEALRLRDWQALFVRRRALWAQARFMPIGHALLEKLLAPRKPITAHAICVALDEGACARDRSQAQADAWLAASAHLEPAVLRAKPFAALPVLGIPQWWPENENFSFYDDSLVFRPLHRTSQAA